MPSITFAASPACASSMAWMASIACLELLVGHRLNPS